jgi:uncharacterized protein YbjQ (UPF0145 family)
MAEIRHSGTWGSALTTGEFAAIRSAGFEPAGQVLGAAVYNIGYTGGYGCPGGWSTGYFGGPVAAATQVSSSGGWGSFGPLARAMYDARRNAIGRMTEECQALGGHGIVGVRLTIGQFPAGGLEFRAIGTAVRAAGTGPAAGAAAAGTAGARRTAVPRRPFTSDLSGQDFAKLIMAGWVPAGLVLGISIAARHDDWVTVSAARWGAGNTEVPGYTELVMMARHDARVQLEADAARVGADAVVIASNHLRVSHRECPGREGQRDHIAEVTIIGTAIARFASATAPTGPAPPDVLAVLSLDPQRRQAARVRLGP